MEKELPQGWTRQESKSKPGKSFFYHAASKTSQWHRPKDAEVGIDTSNATLALRASFFIYAGLCLNSIDWLLKYCISNIIL